MKIAHAAIREKNLPYRIFTGKQHFDCYDKFRKTKPKSYQAENGFITDTGEFVDRKTAAKIAFEAGQIDKPVEVLFSEELWCRHDRFNGRYDYNSAIGYFLRESVKNEMSGL
jgi:hypothetical protein